jgi:hypothetical protein
MNVQTAAAVGSALLSLAFAMSTFERWLARRRPHELMWSIALLMFAIAAAALAAGAGTGWNGPIFRLFIIFGAIANVPFLALGTVYLLGGRQRGDVATAFVALATAFAAGVVTVAPFRAPLPHDQLAQASDVFGPLPRIFAGVASGGGALVVVGGAWWSVWRIRRAGAGLAASRRLVISNSLIAVGTLITGASGILNSVLNQMTGFAVALAVGIAVIFAGFLVATAAPRPLLTASLDAAPDAEASRPSRTAVRAPG